MWHSHRENKSVVISYFIFRPSSTNCISLPLSSTIFYLLLFYSMFISLLPKNFKKRINKKNFKKDERNWVCFWCFWSVEWAWEEQYEVEDESRDWVEAKHVRSAKDWRLASHPLPPFLLSPPLSPSLAQPPHLWIEWRGFGHMVWPTGHHPRPANHHLAPL
jgi:hypothetical protein